MLQILIRNNSGELKSSDLKAYYIEALGVQDYFSRAYVQHQNGPAESSINSIMLLNRLGTQMVESGLARGFWYRGLAHAKDVRNVTYDLIKTTPH